MGKSKGKFDDLLQSRRSQGRDDERNDEPARARTTSVGKRSDSEYRQVSAYIRKDTHREVKIALLQEDREFSELVEELLRGWLDRRT